MTIRFAKGASVIPTASARSLTRLSKGSTVVVAGHADPDEKQAGQLAQQRAERVAAQLRKTGKKVEAVRSFGSELPLASDLLHAERNRRVEVFVK